MVVYQILNTETNKRYIGQTSHQNPAHRWSVHLSYLKQGKHHSPKLQNSWNKYGEFAFEFSIIANCKNIDDMNICEIEAITRYNSLVDGYNCRPGGRNWTRTEEDSRKRGEALKGHTVSKATREAISRANTGNENSLGYKQTQNHIEQRRTKRLITHRFISPNGMPVVVNDIAAFCKENNLSRGNMNSVSCGLRFQHKGWKKDCEESRHRAIVGNKKPHPVFIHSDGRVIEAGVNLKAKCIKYGLNPGCMHHVMNRKSTNHKGWKLAY